MKRHFIRNERQSFATVKEAFSFLALHVGFAQGAVQSTAPRSQNATASRVYSVFLRTQNSHLSNSLIQSHTHSNFAYQVAEFKLGLIFSMCLRMSADLFLKLNIGRSIQHKLLAVCPKHYNTKQTSVKKKPIFSEITKSQTLIKNMFDMLSQNRNGILSNCLKQAEI